jgi:DNA-binding GntR family transcriptional regulator
MWGFHGRGRDARLELSYGDHKMVLKAIREGDVESAVSVMRDHLRLGPQFAAEPFVE